MAVYGKIIVIKRNGSDGSAFPLTSNTCLIGRDPHCDIRIQLSTVSQEHSRLDVKPDGQILLTNLSNLNPTTLNHHPVKSSVHVRHMDIITVADRSLRWEFPANSQYYNSPKQASPLKRGTPNAGNWALNSLAKLLPESKLSPFGDHRSFKVTLGTPRFSPGKKSFQKPLSGKKVPFFLSPKPGKHSPKKILSLKMRGYLSPEKAADPLLIDQGSKSTSPKVNSGSTPTFSKKSSPKTPSQKIHLEKTLSQKVSFKKTPSPSICSKKTSSPKIHSGKKPSLESNKQASPTTDKVTSPKTPSLPKSPKQSKSPASRKSASPMKKYSPKTPQKPKGDGKKTIVSKARRKTSPAVHLKTSPTTPKSTNLVKKTPSPKMRKQASLMPSKKVAGKTPSPKSPSPMSLTLKKGSSEKASKITPSLKSPAKKNTASPTTPRTSVRLSKSATPSPEAKKSPSKTSQKRSRSDFVSSSSSKSPKKAQKIIKSPLSAKTSLRRASDFGFTSRGGRRSLLRISGQTPRSLKVSFGPNLSPEQFDRALPPTTPLRKGGRPKRGTSASPNYYGSTIISPDTVSRRTKRSISLAAASPKAKKMSADKDLASSPKKFSSYKTNSPVTNSPKNARESLKSTKRNTSPKVIPGNSSMEENVVKIFSPASPDSKKSAALRTIHAKLVLNKTVKRNASPHISDTRRKLLSTSRRSADSIFSGLTKLKETPFSPQASYQSAPRFNRRASLAAMSANTSFDMQAFQTPIGPNEMLVSPMTVKRESSPSFLLKRMINASPSLHLKFTRLSTRLSGTRQKAAPLKRKSRFPVKSPKSAYTYVEGVKRLMKSPRKSPKSDYTDVEGVKRLMKSPRKSPKSDYTDVEGVKRLMKSPRKSPKSDYTDVEGVKRLMKSPRKSPFSDYSNVEGVRRLTKSPRKSPNSDYTNFDGVKRLMKSPRKSPKSDYTDVGVKRLMKSPRKSPNSDYTNVDGVKRLMKSPRKSPKSGYTNVGVKRLMKSTRKSPNSDYTNVERVERLLRRAQKSPKSDYTDVTGVKHLFRQQESPQADYSKAKGLKHLMKTPEQIADHEEKVNTKNYPERRNKLEPVNYLGYAKETSPGNSENTPISSRKQRALHSLIKSPSTMKKSGLKRVSTSGSPVLSAKKSFPKVSSAKKSSPKISSAKKSSPKISSAKKSSPKISSAKKSSPKISSAKKSSPKISSAKKSSPKISSAKKSSPKISTKKSSPKISSAKKSRLASQSKRLSLEIPGGRRSSASFSPALNKLFLTPVSRLPSPSKKLTPSPSKKLRASRSITPKPLKSTTRQSAISLSEPSPKTFPVLAPQKMSPVLHAESSNAKYSGRQRLTRPTRSAKTPLKYSPATPTVAHKRGYTASLTVPEENTAKPSVEDNIIQKSSKKSVEIASSSPVKRRRGKPKKTIDEVSPNNNKENDEPLVETPKEKPMRRTRKALKTTRKSPTFSIATLPMVSPKKSPKSPVKTPPKKTRAGNKKRVVIVTPQRNSRSLSKASPFLAATTTRSMQKKPTDADSTSNKRKAKSRTASLKEFCPLMEMQQQLSSLKIDTTSLVQIKSSPAKSPSPLVTRRTRMKAGRATSPKDVKLKVRQTRKTASKIVEGDALLETPKGRSSKRKITEEEQPASKSLKLDTPPVVLPKKMKRGAARKASPAKNQSPIVSPVAPQKKVSNKAHSPAKTAMATRSSRRTKK